MPLCNYITAFKLHSNIQTVKKEFSEDLFYCKGFSYNKLSKQQLLFIQWSNIRYKHKHFLTLENVQDLKNMNIFSLGLTEQAAFKQ